jgi:hypothetical protein
LAQEYIYIAVSLAMIQRSLLSRLLSVQRICSQPDAGDTHNGPQRFKKLYYGKYLAYKMQHYCEENFRECFSAFNVNSVCGCAYFKAMLCYLPNTSFDSTTNFPNSVSYSPNFIFGNYCQWRNINFLILVTFDIESKGF